MRHDVKDCGSYISVIAALCSVKVVLVELVFRPISEEDARAISQWRYEEPYAMYNGDLTGMAALLDLRNAYYSITGRDGELVGYCCFGPDARVPGGDYDDVALDVGLGMRPDFTGKGRGLEFFTAILNFGRERFRPAAFRLTVAAFNQRAIRVYERAGFDPGSRFESTNEGGQEFLQMSMRA